MRLCGKFSAEATKKELVGTMTSEIKDENFITTLRNTEQNLGNGQTVLDFSSVHRLDPNALHSLEHLADVAEQKSAKLSIRGVNVDLYKVLKLMRLSRRFRFVD